MGARTPGSLRSVVAVGVLVVTAGMVVMLLQEARAVSVEVTDPGTLPPAVRTIRVSVFIPDGERIPIDSTETFIEETPTGPPKEGEDEVARAICDSAGSCDTGDLVRSGNESAGILSITFLGAFVNGEEVTEEDFFGYGYLNADGNSDGYGYGYGVAGEELELRYGVEIDGAVLGVGHKWLTFIVHTGSETLGDFTSESQHFRIVAGGGGGPSPPPPDDGLDIPVDPGVPVPIPPGGGEFDVGGVGGDGVTLGRLTIDLAPEVVGASLTVTASQTPPVGAPDTPAGFGTALFLDIVVTGAPPGGVLGGTLTFTLTAAELQGNNPLQVVLLHFGDTWVSVPTQPGPLNPDGSQTFTAILPGFSPFAIVFDRAGPTVGAITPAEAAVVGARPVVSAVLADNRGINDALTRMFVDGQLVQATITAAQILFTPAFPLTAGAHDVRVVATDLSGLTSERNWTFTSQEGTGEGATVTPGSPPPAGFISNKRPLIRADFRSADGFGPNPATMTVDGLPVVGAQVTADAISYTPPADLADALHTVTVTVTDLAGNSDFATWAFTVDTVVPVLGAVEPADGATVASARPTLRAGCSDATSGVVSTVITVDGQRVGADGRPAADLANGRHTATATCTDGAGNTATRAWSFSTTGEAGFPVLTVLLLVALLLAVVGGAALYARRKRLPEFKE